MTDRYYATTPIYYVNDVPHLGSAYTTVVCDAFVRFYKLRGRRTRFLTGTDEHGQKIERAAAEKGLSPAAFVDTVSQAFRDAWPKLECKPDDFLRTTEPRHVAAVQDLWRKCAAAGDLYLGEFEGLYCVPCEAFYTEKELGEGNLCPIHKKPVERSKEQSYFFRLSKYGDRLLRWYESHPESVQPEGRRNEVLSFVREGLRDLSVSRTTFKWGIPVPGDERHVIYVWFDALANYLTALGEGELRAQFWPPDVHFVGKDILRFHAIFWPAFLLSAGYSEEQLPRTVLAHGFLNINGQKMGKSTRNTVEPLRLAQTFGADELRYYLLREVSLGQDGDFSHQGLIARIRSELAAAVGNLLNRTLPFVQKHFDGKVPATEGPDAELDVALRARAAELARESAEHWNTFAPQRALECAINLAQAGNKYFDETAPWALAKDPAKRERLGRVIYHVLEVLRVCSVLLWPALPNKCDALRAQLGLPPVEPREGEDLWPSAWGGLTPGAPTQPGSPLFRNITREDEAKLLAEFALPDAETTPPKEKKMSSDTNDKPADKPAVEAPKPAEAAPEAKPAAPEGVAQIQYTDFERVELKLGDVKTAERIPKKDRLLRLTVDLGEASGPRTIIAGIALAYKPEELVGKQLVVVANLAPRDFGKGLVSYGMLLACGPSESLSLVTVEKPQAAGTRVK